MNSLESCDNLIVIVGPTAVGKTGVAMDLVSKIGGEIVSADSMAVYVGMDIGTAKPTPDEMMSARFHLIDVADPASPFSVGEFQRLAQAAIDDIMKRNPPAVVVGGSGLYVRAAVDGLNVDIPPRDDDLRSELQSKAEKLGRESLHAQLQQLDPITAARIHPNNVKRVIRAIEICLLGGAPAASLYGEAQIRFKNNKWFGLTMNRQRLYARIEDRIDNMIALGLIDEVAELLKKGIDERMTSMQGLGYKEIAGYLLGRYSKQDAIMLLKRNTRRFAKRQYTWFRQDKRIQWLDIDSLSDDDVSETIIRSSVK